MNKLEEYIRDNKNRFDEEPTSGHFERMQQKMNRPSRRTVALRWAVSIAASIAILILAGITLQRHAARQTGRIIVCENTINMKSCYLKKMNAVAGQIEALSKNLDPWDQQQVMTEVQNIINTAGSGLESEIPEELPKNQAKAILSGYYRQNLESLERIMNELAPQPPKGGV